MANKRQTFIINPRFQYRFSFIVCSLIFLVTLIYPIAIYDLFNYVIKMNPETIAKHEEYRNNLFHFLVLLQISLAGAIFVFSIFVSHKIAGPMFKLTRYLQEIRNGAQITHLSFREGDQFPEVAEEINETLEYLTQKNEEEMEYLSEISEYLSNLALVIPDDKKPVLEEIRRKISQFQGIEQ